VRCRKNRKFGNKDSVVFVTETVRSVCSDDGILGAIYINFNFQKFKALFVDVYKILEEASEFTSLTES
jgi:hypothetical protein